MAKMNFKSECISSGGGCCPYCGKRNTHELSDAGYETDEDDVRMMKLECHDCGEEYSTVYRCEDVVEND